jgi:RNA polymerase sigma factor (sigma-70 family)
MSIEELVEQVRKDPASRAAQEELYALIRARLLDRLQGKIPPKARSRLDAEDVLHTAFLKGLASLDAFEMRGEQSFLGWIYRIGKNHILDVVHRRSAAAVRFGGEENGAGPRASQVRSRETRHTARLANREWSESMLRKLKPQEEELVRKHLYLGHSFDEIAREEGRTSGAVQRAFSRAVCRLRELAAEERA